MHQVLQTPSDYWRADSLDTCLLDTIAKLIQGLEVDNIPDLFFPQVAHVLLTLTSSNLNQQVNLLARIKNKKVKHDCRRFLEKALKKYKQQGAVMEIFA